MIATMNITPKTTAPNLPFCLSFRIIEYMTKIKGTTKTSPKINDVIPILLI